MSNTIPNTEITTGWQLVTPAIAKQYLALNHNNRNLRKVNVARMAHDMKNGHYEVTHQGIAVSVTGILLDGQHRLEAIVSSNLPQYLLVTIGLPDSAQKHMDRGALRRTADFLVGSNAVLRASTLKTLLAIRELNGEVLPAPLYDRMRNVTDSDVHSLIEDEPGLAADMAELANLALRASRHCPVTPTALLAAALTFPEAGEDMLNMLVTGIGMEAGSPLLALRNSHQETQRMNGMATFTALRTFDAFLKGKKWTKLQTYGITVPVKVNPR